MRRSQTIIPTTLAAIGLFVAACGSRAATVPASATAAPAASATTAAAPATATAAPTATTSAATATTPTAASALTPTAATSAASTGQSSQPGLLHFNVVPDGTKAAFRVREQLVRLSAPSDAVGTTTKLTGGIVIGADGKIDPEQSKLVVDMTSLQTDSPMRDRFIQGNTLETHNYPTATFVPTDIKGLPASLPTSGQHTFQVVGNMTIHGVSHPVTWDVIAQVDGKDVTGQATTNFKFEDFGMTPPKAGAVLSVNDDVKLEINLHLVQSS